MFIAPPMLAAAVVNHRATPELSHLGRAGERRRVAGSLRARTLHEIAAETARDERETLSYDEVRARLAATPCVVSRLGGAAICDEDIDTVMRLGGASSRATLTAAQMPAATSAFVAILEDRELIRAACKLLKTYDANADGQLDREQLRAVLEQLNENVPVHEDDLDAIVRRCAGDVDATSFGRDELAAAIEYWYSDAHIYDQDEAEERRSWCCVRSRREPPRVAARS